MRSARRRVILTLLLSPFVAYLVWDLVETRGLARDIAAIVARGEPTTLEDQPTGADTAERHDAARIYAAAAERASELPREQTFQLGRLDVDAIAGPPVAVATLEATYRRDSPALQLVDQAAPLDFNGFGDVAPELLINQSSLEMVSVLADLRADLLSVRGQGDAAVESLVASARLLRTLTITFYGYQGSIRLLGSLRILLRHTSPSDASLGKLQHALAQLPDTDNLVSDVQRSRARFLDDIARPRGTLSEAVLLRLLRPWIARASRRQLATFEDALVVARRPWTEKLAAGDALERKYSSALKAMGRRGFFARLTQPFGLGVAMLALGPAALDLAARRVSVAALAIERYRRAHGGVPPPALAALVPSYLPAVPIDPFSGASLVYKASAGGYVLYSVDTNRKDDGGALYGLGSKAQLMPRAGAGRDLGIQVDRK